MCLQGGERVDVSRLVAPTASILELRVTIRPAIGMLVVYCHEDRQASFTGTQSRGSIPFAEPVLCVKAIGTGFEFNIEVMSVEDAD